MNGLRSRVRIEADSKLMSGRDVAIAALLGAEEFGFGTGPLVAMGCVMMRVCNLDTCPMGICTQNPELRKRFKGKPEYIMNFMRFMAEDLREYMAKLGVRTVDELVGRTDLLKVKAAPAGSRAGEMDLTALLRIMRIGGIKSNAWLRQAKWKRRRIRVMYCLLIITTETITDRVICRRIRLKCPVIFRKRSCRSHKNIKVGLIALPLDWI